MHPPEHAVISIWTIERQRDVHVPLRGRCNVPPPTTPGAATIAQRSEPIPTPSDDVPAHPARLTVDDVQTVAEAWERESTATLETTVTWLRERHIRIEEPPADAAQRRQITAVIEACNDPDGFGTLVDLDTELERLGLGATRKLLRDRLLGRPYSPLELFEPVKAHLPTLRSRLHAIAAVKTGAEQLSNAVDRVWPRDGEYHVPRAVPSVWIALEWLASEFWDRTTQVLSLLAKATGLPGNGELAKLAAEHFPCEVPPPPPRLQTVRTHLVVRITRVNSGQPGTKYDVHIRLIEQRHDPDAKRRLLETVTTRGPRTTAAATLETTTISMIEEVRPALTPRLAWGAKDASLRRVDFLLDTDLLSLDVDEWKVDLGSDEPQAIGVNAPVVVRPLQRLQTPGGMDIQAWARRSKEMTATGEARWAVAPGAATRDDEIPYAGDHDEVRPAIETFTDSVVCLGLDAGKAGGTHPAAFLDCGIAAGIPILVWPRDGQLALFREQVKRPPDPNDWRYLPTQLYKLRRSSPVKISMLWDDWTENWEELRPGRFGTHPSEQGVT
ncbi:hypothetical protein [Dactylosporangium sp. NPDC000521]|uniref:VMAP-C domain-containing protein n=1 Tax=Dactylosporangium sp. NPDC000521 TaxID=3363975 RepID=UPI0036C2DCB0